MLSWDEQTIHEAQTECLLDILFAAIELEEATLETMTSSAALYQQLCLRLGLRVQPGSPKVRAALPAALTPVSEGAARPEIVDDLSSACLQYSERLYEHSAAGQLSRPKLHVRAKG